MEETEINMVAMEVGTVKGIQTMSIQLVQTTDQAVLGAINTEVEVLTIINMVEVDIPTDMVIDTVINMATGIVNTIIIN